jgi:N-acetylneuraminate synthase
MSESTEPTKITIIAEVGLNHDGSLGNALALIDAAAECGADVVKFQTHLAEAETLPSAPSPPYFASEPRYEYFKRTAFALDQWNALKGHAEARGLRFLSSVFSVEAVDVLERLGVESYKIPSGEVTNLPLIEHVAKTGKPIYLSSGMNNWAELDAAVGTIRRHHSRLWILQCTSAYPCPYEQVGLNVILEMQQRYRLPIGLSDHTMTNYAAFAAVALGATVVEKHLTFSRRMYGSDAKHSLEPLEFAELVHGIRAVETMLAAQVDKDASALQSMKAVFEKSVVALVNIPTGTVITREMVGLKKPGTGIPPSQLDRVVGRVTVRPVSANTLIAWDDLEGGKRRMSAITSVGVSGDR